MNAVDESTRADYFDQVGSAAMASKSGFKAPSLFFDEQYTGRQVAL